MKRIQNEELQNYQEYDALRSQFGTLKGGERLAVIPFGLSAAWLGKAITCR
jgi:hypothetical protein